MAKQNENIRSKKRDEAFSAELLVVWESSVRATHDFLSDTEVKRIKDYVPKALYSVKHLTVAENDLGKVLAFAGAENGRLEMLFFCRRRQEKASEKRFCAIPSETSAFGSLRSTSRI